MRFSAGDRFGDYTLNHHLGRGGMADVWSATHGVLGVTVALKVLLSGHPKLQARLLREGRVQLAMNHPNILSVRDVVSHNGVPGLVLPLIAGPSLDRLLKTYSLTEAESIAVFKEIVQGVAHAHEHGLIHRDLKPGNVLLDERAGRICPRIADFGLVKDLSEDGQTRTGAVMGTLNYAAPEQLLNAAGADHRADLFSLGVILVELVTGHLPFRGGSLGEMLEAYREPPHLEGVSEDCQVVCRELLAVEPRHRTRDCQRLLEWVKALDPRVGLDPLRGNGAMAQAAHALVVPPPEGDSTPDPWGTLATFPHGVRSVGTLAPPLVSLPPHNLPAELDAFVGREVMLRRLHEITSASRLVSVLGTGGIGKTRFALAFARMHLSSYPGGVFFCDLSEARTLEGVVSVVAQAMGVPLGKGDHALQLGYAIAGRGRSLFVFDNFEQVVGHAADTVEQWLRRSEEAQFIVTTRVLLEVTGEHALRLPPLDETEAVNLFVERASKKKADFVLGAHNQETITALVRLLDGLPLAIELATARVKVMKPAVILRRMNQRFKLLATGKRHAVGRQTTLRAAIDWSWDLLTGWEKVAFSQCAVFEGGFTLEAAEAVIALDDFGEAPWPMDAVQSLVDKSLLRPIGENRLGERRFGMLVSLHEYATEKLGLLDASSIEAARHRHMEFYGQFGERRALDALERFGGVERWWALFVESENLLTAHRFALQVNEADAAVRLVLTLGAIARRQQPSLALKALKSTLTLSAVQHQAPLRAKIELRIGAMYISQGQMKVAGEHYQRALEIYRSLGNRRDEGTVLDHLGTVFLYQGQTDLAAQHYEDALGIHRESGDRYGEGVVLGNLSIVASNRGDFDGAIRSYQCALHIHREVGNRRAEGIVLGNLGSIYFNQGEMLLAEQHQKSALNIHREVGNRHGEGNAVGMLGSIYVNLEQADLAAQHFRDALRIHRESGNRGYEAIVLGNFARLHLHQGRVELAEQQLLEALETATAFSARYLEGHCLSHLGLAVAIQGRVDEGLSTLQQGEELLRATDNQLLLGELLCNRAHVEHLAGRPDASQAALIEARQIACDLKLAEGAGLVKEIARAQEVTS